MPKPPSKKTYLQHLKDALAIGLITVLLLEACLWAWAAYGSLPIKVPAYELSTSSEHFWQDINPHFGVQHAPNSSYQHVKSCFSVTYHSNSYGFRDIERNRESEQARTILLGDSFIEGYGIESEFRISNRLEKLSGRPHLNFGMAGSVGSTQYSLIYKHLASSFQHDTVLIGLLPANDFMDDDIEFGKKNSFTRYRPYWVGEYPNYELSYFIEDLEQSEYHPSRMGKLGFFKQILREFTYSYNLASYMAQAIRQSGGPAKAEERKKMQKRRLPNYFEYSSKQLNRMRYSLEQIRETAGKRPIYIFTIPSLYELKMAKDQKKMPELSEDLSVVCDSLNMRYLDLFPYFYEREEKWKDYYLPCDGHWTAEGNQFATELLLEHLLQ